LTHPKQDVEQEEEIFDNIRAASHGSRSKCLSFKSELKHVLKQIVANLVNCAKKSELDEYKLSLHLFVKTIIGQK